MNLLRGVKIQNGELSSLELVFFVKIENFLPPSSHVKILNF